MPSSMEQLQTALTNQSCPSGGIANNLGDWIMTSSTPIPPIAETCDENDSDSFNADGAFDFSGDAEYSRGAPEFEQTSLNQLTNQNPQSAPSSSSASGANGGKPPYDDVDIDYNIPSNFTVAVTAAAEKAWQANMMKEVSKSRDFYQICGVKSNAREDYKFIVNGTEYSNYSAAQQGDKDARSEEFENFLDEFEDENGDDFENLALATVTATSTQTAVLPEVIDFQMGDYSLGFSPTLALQVTETTTADQGQSTLKIDTSSIGSSNTGNTGPQRGGGGGTGSLGVNGSLVPGPVGNPNTTQDESWRIGVQMRATYTRGGLNFNAYATYDPYGNHSLKALCTWFF